MIDTGSTGPAPAGFDEQPGLLQLLAGSLDVLAMPTLLFDASGRLAHCNRSAGILLAGRQSLWVEGRHLVTRDAEATRKLKLELSKALRSSQGQASSLHGVVSLPRRGRLPLLLMLTPMRLQRAALLFVFDPEATPGIRADMVRPLFGLSQREAEVAAALCTGRTLDDLAAERGTSINTLRTQLKSVFNKTGTSRQADLVSLMLASPACLLAQD